MPKPVNIDRRTLMHTLVQGGLALGLMPGIAESASSAVAAGRSAPPRALATPGDMIAVIADAILPRSDTPGATDVGVPAWIDAVVAGYFSDSRRVKFLADLAAIDDFALTQSGARLAALPDSEIAALIAALDAAIGTKQPTPAQRGYAQLKELVLVGYFTSKPVQTDILKVVVVPGHYDPNVQIAPPGVK